MLPFSGNYYYLSFALQAICVIHCMRKGNANRWIWIIVFLPLIGCLAYIFTEIFTGNEVQQLQSGMGRVFRPLGSVKKMEEQLRFSDTFNNRVGLADACLAAGDTKRAIELYESSLQGTFSDNEYVFSQLIVAYSITGQYAEILPIAKKIYSLPQFKLARVHVLYAIALEKTGNTEMAEKEFLQMKVRYANFEARYEYGQFLIRAGRTTEAQTVLSEVTDEYNYLSAPEKRSNRRFVQQAKEVLKKLK